MKLTRPAVADFVLEEDPTHPLHHENDSKYFHGIIILPKISLNDSFLDAGADVYTFRHDALFNVLVCV